MEDLEDMDDAPEEAVAPAEAAASGAAALLAARVVEELRRSGRPAKVPRLSFPVPSELGVSRSGRDVANAAHGPPCTALHRPAPQLPGVARVAGGGSGC